jgi:hypothetical protein
VLRRALPPLIAALLLAPACSSDDTAGAERTTTTSTTTSTVPADPYAVPDEIDTGYVAFVTNELLRVLSEAVRIAMREGEVTPEVEDIYNAAYTDRSASSAIQSLRDQAEAGFPGIKDPRGDTRAAISSIRETEDGCIVADGELDLNDVQTDPASPGPMVFSLRRQATASQHNVTGWAIRVMAPRGLFTPESDGCSAS